jgi:hypothetical protein
MEFLLEDDGGFLLPEDKAAGEALNAECDGCSVVSESTTASGSTSASSASGLEPPCGSPPPPLPGVPAKDFRCPICLRDFYKKDSFCI